MAIPEAGQHVHAFGGNDFGIGRHVECANGADRSDALVFDDDHAVRERMTAKAVNQPSTDQRNRARLCRCNYDEKKKCSDKASVHHQIGCYMELRAGASMLAHNKPGACLRHPSQRRAQACIVGGV